MPSEDQGVKSSVIPKFECDIDFLVIITWGE